MEMKLYKLRSAARHQLKGKWKSASFVIFFSYMLISGFSILIAFPTTFSNLINVPESLWKFYGFIAAIATLLFSAPVYLGLAKYFIDIKRGNSISSNTVIEGFNKTLPSMVLYFFITLFTILWGLLLIIPGIIAHFRYAMSFYIMNDYPELSPLEVLRKSKKLMKGNKMKLFLLSLSFIGWYFLAYLMFGIATAIIVLPIYFQLSIIVILLAFLLALAIVITTCISFFFISSYVNTSFVNFYDAIKEKENLMKLLCDCPEKMSYLN